MGMTCDFILLRSARSKLAAKWANRTERANSERGRPIAVAIDLPSGSLDPAVGRMLLAARRVLDRLGLQAPPRSSGSRTSAACATARTSASSRKSSPVLPWSMTERLPSMSDARTARSSQSALEHRAGHAAPSGHRSSSRPQSPGTGASPSGRAGPRQCGAPTGAPPARCSPSATRGLSTGPT
mgnify:CR=1 FL=1